MELFILDLVEFLKVRAALRILQRVFHHILQLRSIDLIHIRHIANIRWCQSFLVNVNVSVAGTSVCDVDINIYYDVVRKIYSKRKDARLTYQCWSSGKWMDQP